MLRAAFTGRFRIKRTTDALDKSMDKEASARGTEYNRLTDHFRNIQFAPHHCLLRLAAVAAMTVDADEPGQQPQVAAYALIRDGGRPRGAGAGGLRGGRARWWR